MLSLQKHACRLLYTYHGGTVNKFCVLFLFTQYASLKHSVLTVIRRVKLSSRHIESTISDVMLVTVKSLK